MWKLLAIRATWLQIGINDSTVFTRECQLSSNASSVQNLHSVLSEHPSAHAHRDPYELLNKLKQCVSVFVDATV